jgi:hypothetical protein
MSARIINVDVISACRREVYTGSMTLTACLALRTSHINHISELDVVFIMKM